MESGHPPQPPQTPAIHVETSTRGQVAIHRYSQGNQEVVVRRIGDVAVSNRTSLDIPDNGRVDVEIHASKRRIAIVWDASGCTVHQGSTASACDAAEREFVVLNLKQQLTPPIPPRLKR